MKLLLACILVSVAVGQGEPLRYVSRLPAVRARRPMDAVQIKPQQDGTKRNGGGRIIGGSPAAEGQFPWQAAVRLNYASFCGGSLITERNVLTAGHCADGISVFSITLGSLSSAASPDVGLVLVSQDVALHPNFWSDGHTTDNDVAVVHLPEKVTFTDLIQPVRLPSASQVDETFAGWGATLSGWGRVSDAVAGVSPTLQFVDLTIITNDECNEAYHGNVTIDQICTKGATNQGSCNGDSGGPLVVLEEDGKYTEVGVVSFGPDEGCELGAPSAYARVTTYLAWINENLVDAGR